MQRGAAALAVCLWLSGCEADDPCDEGYTYKQGACLLDPEMESKDAGATPDAGDVPAEDAGENGTECDEDQSQVLGKSCMSDEGCNCAAPYCALQPGQTVGFCTVNCKPSPDDCPNGYRCFDLSALGVQGIEPFCVAK
jgi:hypothetical protein